MHFPYVSMHRFNPFILSFLGSLFISIFGATFANQSIACFLVAVVKVFIGMRDLMASVHLSSSFLRSCDEQIIIFNEDSLASAVAGCLQASPSSTSDRLSGAGHSCCGTGHFNRVSPGPTNRLKLQGCK